MAENKQKFALWVYPETLSAVEELYQIDNCRSKSEFIEKAINFYAGYKKSDFSTNYLPNVILSTIQGTLDSFENRMAALLFKLAVEISMMLHVTAATNSIDEDTLTRLRGLCVAEVKRIHGSVRMEEAAQFQKGGE